LGDKISVGLEKKHLLCGVPQGSVLGPILLSCTPPTGYNARFSLSPHLYVDDIQVFGACSPTDVDVFPTNVNECFGAVADWIDSNRLQLNSDKTEFLWCTTSRRQHRLPAAGPTIGEDTSSLPERLATWESSSTPTCYRRMLMPKIHYTSFLVASP